MSAAAMILLFMFGLGLMSGGRFRGEGMAPALMALVWGACIVGVAWAAVFLALYSSGGLP